MCNIMGAEPTEMSERHAAEILDNIADPLIAFDRGWRFTYVNSRAAAALGKTPAELIGSIIWELFPEDVGSGFREGCERAWAQDAPVIAELNSQAPGAWVEYRISPIQGGAAVQWRDIAPRERAKSALRESELYAARSLAEIEAIYEFAPIGLCVLDANMRFVRVNRRFAEMSGFPAEAHIGKTPGELNPDLDEAADEALRRVLESGRPLLDLEVRGTTAAQPGVQRIWNEHWVPMRNQSGTVIGVGIAAEEITERKRAEEALQVSEERFRRLVEVTSQIVWVANAAGESIGDSPSWRAFTGLPAENWVGRNWLEAVHPDDRERVAEACRFAVETGAPYRMEFRQLHASGEYRDIECQAAPVLNPDATVREWVGMNVDVTERKRAERELAAAIQRLQAHMDNSPLAVIEFDPQFRVTRWSSEAQRIFGWRAEEVLGRAIPEMRWVHEDDAENVREVSRDMLEGRRPRNVQVNRNYRKDGAVIECEWYNSAIYDGEGRLASVLSQVLDVTDRKRTEERLRQAQKTESIALLAGGVAHDFNNLLVGVIGNAGLALEMLPPESPVVELLQRIIGSGEQAAHLTRQMLAYSGRGRFVVEPVDLSDVVLEVTDLVRSTAPKKIAIELELQPGLPAIEADRSQIHQVLVNLVINATEAIGGKPGVIAVRTGTRQIEASVLGEFDAAGLAPGRYVFLEIRDTGCGMNEATRARIFDPFFTTKLHGRGLGLAAVSGIMRGHKGAIQVRTAPGRGASFLLWFPAAESRPPAGVSRPRAEKQAELQLGGAVLIVDDEEGVRHTVKTTLERRGCRVLAVSSGPEAIAALKKDPGGLALVILDLSMPGMSGPEVLPELLAVNPQLDVLISSGYTETDTVRLFEGMRIAGFIQKPYTPRRLVEKVRALAEMRGTAPV